MKKFTVIFFLILNANMIFCQRAVPGILKSSPQAFSPLSIPPPLGAPIVLTKSCDAASGNEKSFKTFCNDDDICAAKKLNFCADPAKEIECKGTTPYCVEEIPGEAYCSETQAIKDDGSSCQSAATTFVCRQFGILPDPLNCKGYFYCYKDSAGAWKSDSYACPDLYVFDPTLPNETPCRFTNDKRYCVTSKCEDDDLSLQILNYPSLRSDKGEIGIRCIGTKAERPIVVRCGANSKLSKNKFIPDCIFTCRREGQKGIYTKDDTKYYHCFRAANGFNPVLKSCLPGTKFDPEKLQCVASSK